MSGLTGKNPFVGPRPIEPGESLFGRDAEVEELYHLLQARRIVVLHAPSGAGKSSLVNAALIPKLKEAKFDPWKPIRVNWDKSRLKDIPRKTNRYILSALASLEEEIPEAHRRSLAELSELDFLKYLESRPRRKGREDQPVVLLFDQFEELLTVGPREVEQKRGFFDDLGKALDTGKYWALFVVREDFLAGFAPYRDRIPTQMSNTFRLDLLSKESAKEAAEKLAQEGGRTFPAVKKLVQNLATIKVQRESGDFVEEQGRHVEPVLLQVVCHRLWKAMPKDDLSIDEDDIGKYADVSTSLAGYYADIVKKLADGDLKVERAARDWVGNKLIVRGIRSLVRSDTGRSSGLDDKQIKALLDSYLVRKEERAGATWFESSHDRLVEAVVRDNQAWTKEHLHPLQVQAKLWEDGERAPGLLLSADGIKDAAAWVEKNAALMTAGETAFWKQSTELRARERASQRWVVGIAAVAVVVAMVMGGVVWWAIGQRDAAQMAEAWAEVAKEEARNNAEEAKKLRDAARTGSFMEGTRELWASGQIGPAALTLASVPNSENVRGWSQLAIDILEDGVPESTLRHEGSVSAASWSPDGKRIVTASEDQTARVWNADNSGTALVLKGHTNSVNAASWSPDGQFIVTASNDNTARVWKADGSGMPVVLQGHEEGVYSASWSPDGKRIVTASDDDTARVWNANGSGAPVVLKGHKRGVNTASWSPDGKRVVTASDDDTARVWNADGSGTPRVLKGHISDVFFASWSPDGQRIVTVSADNTARVWDADGSGTPVVLKGHESWVLFASWSPDSKRIVTTSADNTARVWDADGSGTPVVLKGHAAYVKSASWSPDGKRIVTTSADNTTRVWDAENLYPPRVLKGHASYVNSASWSPDGKHIVTASSDKTARVWNAEGSGTARVVRGHDGEVNSASWSPDGQHIVTASLDKTARVWNADGSGAPLIFKEHGALVKSASWSPDSKRIVTASSDKTARVWSADGSGTSVVLRGHEGIVKSALWSPDGKRIVTVSDDKTGRVWNADGSGTPVVLTGHNDVVWFAAWSPGGERIVTASKDGTARVWNADGSGTPVVFMAHTKDVNSASWSPDGKRIVTASDDLTARVWNADGTGMPVVLEGHEGIVFSAYWSPDGVHIVTVSKDRTARVWNADGSGTPVVLRGHGLAVSSASWSPDGKRIVTASWDATTRVWNADGSGTPLVLKGHTSGINSAYWSPDGKRIVTASWDKTARIWLLDIPLLQQAIRDATIDCLTADQRHVYLLETEPEALAAFKTCERSHGRLSAP